MIFIIAAISQNGVIGDNNQLLWHLSSDLKHFKSITTGNSVLMGRKTYDSLPKHPLPDRQNIILTHQPIQMEGCVVIHSFAELQQVHVQGDLYVIGGAQIFKYMLPYAQRLIITWIWKDFVGDTTFPQIGENEWKIISHTPHILDEVSHLEYSYYVYERV